MPPKKPTTPKAKATKATNATKAAKPKKAPKSPKSPKSPKAPKSNEPPAALAHFPPLPPPPPGFTLPKPGEPASWEDEFERLPAGPSTPSLTNTHWSNARKEFWRFEPDGKMSWGASGGVSLMDWKQNGPWLYIVSNGRGAEVLARIEADTIAGYLRTNYGISTLEYGRGDGATIDEYIRARHAHVAWISGPRDQPQPVMPQWPPRSSRPARAAPPLRFANHRAARSLAAMTAREQAHLAGHAATIAEQAEFGGVEATDLLDGANVAYQLYWWPFTDGVLVETATGNVVADLVDGTLSIDDATLRARVQAGYAAGSLPVSIRIP